MLYFVLFSYEERIFESSMKTYVDSSSFDFVICVAQCISDSMKKNGLTEIMKIGIISIYIEDDNQKKKLADMDPKIVFNLD